MYLKKNIQINLGDGDTVHNSFKEEQIKKSYNATNLPNGGENFQIGIIRDLIKDSEDRILLVHSNIYFV